MNHSPQLDGPIRSPLEAASQGLYGSDYELLAAAIELAGSVAIRMGATPPEKRTLRYCLQRSTNSLAPLPSRLADLVDALNDLKADYLDPVAETLLEMAEENAAEQRWFEKGGRRFEREDN